MRRVGQVEPRRRALAANNDSAYSDLGICGPLRTDMTQQTQYCGMFLTPSLRNVATRRVFFHNGVYHSLQQVLDFYDFRDIEPERIYPRCPDGTIDDFSDLPPQYHAISTWSTRPSTANRVMRWR